MKTLSLANPLKTLSIALAGVFMGALLLAPMTTLADDDDDDNGTVVQDAASIPMFVLMSVEGEAHEFTLVENGSGRVLAVYEDGPDNLTTNDDDDE